MHGARDNFGKGRAIELHGPPAVADFEGEFGRMIEADMLGHFADDG
ncbi:hypothetical protein BPNPMPFG_004482 [Mesorhizobium sp. AR07]|nr:hypothetical protein BPNPMPFG_004482 [Mesorhizobium sp. AR07]